MLEFETPRYSRREIEDAGKALGRVITDYDEAVGEVFRVAHNWRSSYMRPMVMVRADLKGKARRAQVQMVTGARLKRMQSIRRKLAASPLTLYQIQDIGGCRGVLDSIADVEKLARLYQDGESRHKVSREDNLMLKPRISGYRSHHLVLKFSGVGEDQIYNRQRIEVQLRTKMQHAWATAVEAVGLVRNENLKGGEGNADWLRLFQIMSSEIAIEENCPLIPGVPHVEKERRQELLELERKLQAIKELEAYNNMIKSSEDIILRQFRFCLLQYDYENKEVYTRPLLTSERDAYQYDLEEKNNKSFNTVLVEVDKMEDLKTAFPNYFLDVHSFTGTLRRVVLGGHSSKYENLSWVRKFMPGSGA